MPGGLVGAVPVLSSGWRAAVLLGQAQGAPPEPAWDRLPAGRVWVVFILISALPPWSCEGSFLPA